MGKSYYEYRLFVANSIILAQANMFTFCKVQSRGGTACSGYSGANHATEPVFQETDAIKRI